MPELRTWPTPYGPIVQRKIYANLFTEVIRTGKCILCAACMAVCPTNAIVIMGEAPRLIGVCIKCGYCYYACPSTQDENFKGFEAERDRVEERIFGRVRDRVFGVYRSLFLVKQVDDDKANRDEAVLRRIFMYTLDKGYFDVVGFQGYGRPVTRYLLNPPRGRWEAYSCIALTSSDLSGVMLKPLTPGYTFNSARGALEELVNGFFHGVDPIRMAIFGSPQHIWSVWRMRFSWAEHRKLSRIIVFTASTFERPYFKYSDLRRILLNKGINLDGVEDWVFDTDSISFRYRGEWIKIGYKELEDAVYSGFKVVRDPTGEYADISVGWIGELGGVAIIARSEEGDRLVREVIGEGVLEAIDVDEGEIIRVLEERYGGVE